jgi:hypothetical protein
MEAISSSDTSGATQQTTRRHIPEDDTLHNHRCENLKSYERGIGYSDQIDEKFCIHCKVKYLFVKILIMQNKLQRKFHRKICFICLWIDKVFLFLFLYSNKWVSLSTLFPVAALTALSLRSVNFCLFISYNENSDVPPGGWQDWWHTRSFFFQKHLYSIFSNSGWQLWVLSSVMQYAMRNHGRCAQREHTFSIISIFKFI